MKTIQVEELEQLSADEIQVIDLRPGAVNLPMEEFDSRYEEVLEKEKPIYFICHTGERSKDYIETATKAGYNAFNVEGGYRAYLRLSLSRFLEEDTKESREVLLRNFGNPSGVHLQKP